MTQQKLSKMSISPFVFFYLLFGCAHALLCECDSRYCEESYCETDGVCFVSLKRSNKDGSIDKVTRCLDKAYLIPKERPFICEYNLNQNHTYVNKCCKDQNFCTRNLDLSLGVMPIKTDMNSMILLAVAIPICTALLILLPALYLYRRKKVSSTGQSGSSDSGSHHCYSPLLICCQPSVYHEVESVETQSTYPVSSPSLQDILTLSTGSGSGLPLLVQRSVARQVTLNKIIGKGRFGEVWKGQWRGDNVAVKIFSSVEERSWFREVEIYQTVMLRHPNILGFIAADNKDNGMWTQLLLITEYMENGSLYDYLRANQLTMRDLLEMAQGIATGLSHLHHEIVGTHGKPAIAHRDLKSKNVLVRSNGACAIGDLGLAVRYSRETKVLDLPQNSKVGTKRYLPPECLDESMNTSDFEAFTRGDMYSLGLLLWEMATRTEVGGRKVNDHTLPFADIVGSDPTMEDMKKVVCVDGARPPLPLHWLGHPVMARMSNLVSECWYETASSRLTSLRVKKTLTEILILSKKSSTTVA